jgi:hypothetical protein
MLAVRTSLSAQQLGSAFSAGDKEAGESTSIALFAGDVVARGAGPATLVALPPRPPDAKPVAIVDQPTCFEDLGATLVSSAVFVVDYVRKYGLPAPKAAARRGRYPGRAHAAPRRHTPPMCLSISQ